MIRFLTFASSSKGNASLASFGDTHILIDAGISCLRIRKNLEALSLSLSDLSALLVTHAHSDHTAGIATLVKKTSLPILSTPMTARQLAAQIPGVTPLLRPFTGVSEIGPVRVELIPTCHDCPGSAGFRLDCGEDSMGYLTDTGVIPMEAKSLLGTELLVLEANHDVEMVRTGPYPYALKQRVLGREGHLSNDMAAKFAKAAALAGTKQIILAHLSEDNNTPSLAYETVHRALQEAAFDGTLSLAPHREASPLYVMEGLTCSV